MTSAPFGREALVPANLRMLHAGRWANAVVWLLEQDGQPWVVKDFRSRPFIVRNSIGRILVRRELEALQRLRGVAGVPVDGFQLDAHALAYRFVPGRTVYQAQLGPRFGAYFLALERVLEQAHAVGGLVHLDVRHGTNVLVTDQDEPLLIDWQSQLGTRWMPSALRGWLQRFDMSGVYKHWARLSPDTLDESRRRHLEDMNRWRRLWFLRGYFGVRKSRSPH